MKTSVVKRNITIYYITRFFVGFRFVIPIWATFFLRIISFEQMALGELISFLIAAVVELPSGALADLIGRRTTVGVGFIIKGAGYFMLVKATDFSGYIFATCLETIGNTFVSGAEDALIYDTLKENKKLDLFVKIKSIESRIYYTTLLISTLSAGYLYKIRVFIPYLLTGLGTFLAGISYFFTKEPTLDTEKYTFRNYILKFKNGFLESFKNRQITLVTIYYLLIYSGAFLLLSYFELPFIKWLGFTERQASWIFGILIFLRVITMSFAPKIEKKLRYKKINLLLPLIPGLFLLFSFKNSLVGLIVLVIENIVLEYRFIFTSKFYNQFIDSKHRAAALSTLSMFINVIYVSIVYGLTKVLQLTNIGFSFNVIGGILLVAALLSLKLGKNRLPAKTK